MRKYEHPEGAVRKYWLDRSRRSIFSLSSLQFGGSKCFFLFRDNIHTLMLSLPVLSQRVDLQEKQQCFSDYFFNLKPQLAQFVCKANNEMS